MATDVDGQLPGDVAKLTFEEAMAELESVVNKLESGDVPLEQSIDLYTRGTQLRAHCANKLSSAQEKIEKITLSREGMPLGVETLNEDPSE